jgi:cytochrome c-type biogenesis protein CcmH
MRRSLGLVAIGVLVAVPALAQDVARGLEERLVAPCCWNEMLAIHDSPLANELRTEIDARVARGEAVDAIETDLVARYGERIRAIPEGVEAVSVVLSISMALAVVQLFLMARRWRDVSRARAEVPTDAPARPRDEADDRLDRELADFDEP